MRHRRFLTQLRIVAGITCKLPIVAQRVEQQIATHGLRTGDIPEPIGHPHAKPIHRAAGLLEMSLRSLKVLLRTFLVSLCFR